MNDVVNLKKTPQHKIDLQLFCLSLSVLLSTINGGGWFEPRLLIISVIFGTSEYSVSFDQWDLCQGRNIYVHGYPVDFRLS